MSFVRSRLNLQTLGVLQLLLLVCICASGRTETNAFRFAWLSDTHVGSETGSADLRASVQDINATTGLSFVLISGDITEYGSRAQLKLAKSILDELTIPCHVIPGNHDTKWSESGATDFARLWSDDRFDFDFGGYRFIGVHEGPLMRMGDGHWAPQDLRWLAVTLAHMPEQNQPVVFVTHYPVNESIDNWYEGLDLLKRFNLEVILCGHGHANRSLSFENLPGVMGRSNLGTSKRKPGFNLVEVREGKMTFVERLPGGEPQEPWCSLVLRDHRSEAATNTLIRPDLQTNKEYPEVRERWRRDTGFTITAAPTKWKKHIIAADYAGTVRAFSAEDGKPKWLFRAKGPIVSTPAIAKNRILTASTDGTIYSLDAANGNELWRVTTSRPIVASPVVHGERVFVGSSEGIFRSLDLTTGKPLWEYTGINGFVETKPLVYRGKVIFGAWDEHLYALDESTGRLIWQWKGTQPGVLYSPAACWPVAAKGRVFIAAPDRKLTSLSASTGEQLWTSRQFEVRESLGLSEDGSRLLVRSMNNFFYAFPTATSIPEPLWTCNARFGYDINSAMLTEKSGVVFYGTKNGTILALDSRTGTVRWRHRLGVALVNTVLPLSRTEVAATDADGGIVLLEERNESLSRRASAALR